jgi:hypothetical protein
MSIDILRAWETLRNKLCPKRLYKYGTLGLEYFDDRSKKEKFFDRVERYVDMADAYLTLFRAKQFKTSHIFHSFWDISTKQWISSVGQIKQIEKEKGLIFWSFDEMEKEAARGAVNAQKHQDETIKRDMRRIFKELHSGKSFRKELKRDIENGKFDHDKDFSKRQIHTFGK